MSIAVEPEQGLMGESENGDQPEGSARTLDSDVGTSAVRPLATPAPASNISGGEYRTQIKEEDEWGKGLLAPIGVLPSEEPYLRPNLITSDYKGVIIPGNLLVYVLKLDKLAKSAEVDVEIFLGGLLRLISEYGVDEAEALLAGDPIGEKDAEGRAFMRKLIELENIRVAVIQGTVEVLQLNNVGRIFSPLQLMIKEPDYRGKVFALIRELVANERSNISIAGPSSPDALFTPMLSISIKDALACALPHDTLRAIKRVGGGDHAQRAQLISRGIKYPQGEIGVVGYHLLDAGSPKKRRKYISPRGMEGPQLGGSRVYIAEHLREVACASAELIYGKDKSRQLRERWYKPNPDLDGLGFTVKPGGEVTPGKAPRRDPYYASPDQLLPLLQDDEHSPVEPQGHCISQVIAIPHAQGNPSRALVVRGGISGQQAEVMQGVVRPLIERFIETLPPASRDAVVELHYGRRGRPFMEWLNRKDLVIPSDGEGGLFADWFKVIAHAIASSASNKLGGSASGQGTIDGSGSGGRS